MGVTVHTLRASVAGFALALATAGAACMPAASPSGPTVSLRMHGTPAMATVTIADQYVGPLQVVAARGVALPRGQHRISVEAPGYLPWDRLVEAKEEPVRLELQLVPVPE